MPLHYKNMKLGQVLIWLSMMCCWVVMLAGLGRVSNMCEGNGLTPGNPDFENSVNPKARAYVRDGQLIPFGLPWNQVPGNVGPQYASDNKCGILFSLDWWIVMYQFFLGIFTIICVLNEKAHALKHTLMAFYVIGVFQTTIFSSVYTKFYFAFNGGKSTSDHVGQGCGAALAGSIGVTVLEYVFLFLFGSSEVGVFAYKDDQPEPQAQVKITA